ncbi:UNVERIFIED_CONTAM: hypothetical protein Slati_2155800 [Sesamum latifolium]|uniref:DUF4283 domain-containing protein n=1 Tax=Sesamum latifolium TaxID=2727402 RepID=A0AAW2WUC6_9LAMI
MAKGKKSKPPSEYASYKSGQPSIKTTSPAPTKAMPAIQPSTSVKQTAMDPTDFHAFISDMQASPSIAPTPAKAMAAAQPATMPPVTADAAIDVMGAKKTSFAGLFSTNRKFMDEKKLTKVVVSDATLMLDANGLIDVRTKLGHCLVGYIAGKFPGLKAIGALSKSWGATFQQHASGSLVFKFATEEDMQRIMAGGSYFIFGRPLMLKIMSACFGFQEDDISLTPVWVTLLSLPLEC